MSFLSLLLTNGDFIKNMSPGTFLELLITGELLKDLYEDIRTIYLGMLSSERTIKFSTNTTGNLHFSDTKEQICSELDLIDIRTRISAVLSQCPSRLEFFILLTYKITN